METNKFMFYKLKNHMGHAVAIVGYKDHDATEVEEYENIALQCYDCNEVILDSDKVSFEEFKGVVVNKQELLKLLKDE